MATNDILPFGATASNELSQAAYAADAQRLTGNQPGVARSALNNKALHQVSLIASGVGQYIADRQATNVTDTLTPAQIASMLADSNIGRLLNVRVITATGTYTPTAGTKKIRVRMTGGGSSGGGTPAVSGSQMAAGAGGASGSYAEAIYTTGFAGVTVTIGAGGVGVANGSGAGGTSSFGALLTCPGGGATPYKLILTSTVVAQGGQGGVGTGPTGSGITFASLGQFGWPSNVYGTITEGVGGQGGGGPFGPGAGNAAVLGGPGISYGSGGGGSVSYPSEAGKPGGNGAPGVCVIEEFA